MNKAQIKWERTKRSYNAFVESLEPPTPPPVVQPIKSKGRAGTTIHLTHGKTAHLILPEGITESDIKIIQHHLEGMRMKIQLDERN